MSSPSQVDAQSPSGPPPSSALDQMFHALSHAMRRQILIVLFARGGSMTAGEIADRFKCAWPTTTRHLGVLEKSGAIVVTKQGRNRLYSLAAHPLLRAADWIYSWAGTVGESRGDDDWKSLSYASMRNASPPKTKAGGEPKKKTRKGKKPTKSSAKKQPGKKAKHRKKPKAD